jgi:MinD-like ATPase involved in chromosome partitioning or flagellar assembly
MHDQADQLRKLVRQAVAIDGSFAPGGPVVALSGARPGVGVTTAACGLAKQFAHLGKQVILIDANLQRPSSSNHASTSLDQAWSGLAPKHAPRSCSLNEVLAGKRRAVEALVAVADGVRVLPGDAAGEPPPLDRAAIDRCLAEFAALSQQADVLLIDAGSGASAWVDRLWHFAGQVLLVAPPESNAMLDAYAAVKLAQYHRLDHKFRLLLNRCDDEPAAAALAQRFAATCRRFLFVGPRPHAMLPTHAGSEPAADVDQFLRATRLLAADLACDFRASAIRLPRTTSRPASASAPTTNRLPAAHRLPSWG